MSRIAPQTSAALVLIAALALTGLGPVGVSGPRDAGAAECTWQRHVKRVVKRVRRHGKTRRVVRKRIRWTCEAAAAAPAAPLPPPAPPTEPPPPEEPQPNRLGVKSAEYFFILSRPSVAAGEVTVELDNYGEDPHNLNLQRQGGGGEPVLEIAETGPQGRTVEHFDLPAGTYRLWCSLPQHDELGMHATLEVGGS